MIESFLAGLGRSSLAAGVLVILVLLMQRLLRRQLPPGAQCLLWALVMIRLLPFSVPSEASLFNLLPRWAALAPRENRTAAPHAAVIVPAEFTAAPSIAQAAGQGTRKPVVATPGRDHFLRWTLATMLFGIWFAVALVLVGSIVVASVALNQAVRRARPIEDASAIEQWRECCVRMGLRRVPGMFETDAVSVPTLHGVWRPRLLLPTDFTGRYSAAEQRLVFLHELAHVRRRDLPLNWVVTALQVVHWFNPLVWLAFSRWRIDREIACDAQAMAAAGGDARRAYGETMLRLLENFGARVPRVGLVGILDDKRQLRRRLRAIGRAAAAAPRPLVSAGVFAVLALAGLTDARERPAFIVAAGPPPAAPAPAPRANARSLSPADVQALEEALKANPDDLAARTKLLRYYMQEQYRSPEARAAREQHVLWLIEHQPAADIRGPEISLNKQMEPGPYEEGKVLWQNHVKAQPNNVTILDHAAEYCLLNDREIAEELWTKAEQLDPANPRWPERLAHLYGLNATTRKGPDLAMAAKALAAMERAKDKATNDDFNYVISLAKMAFTAGEFGKARDNATAVLQQAPDHHGQWNYGNAIHDGNCVLGRVALRNGDAEAARTFLLAAGQTPGSPQLNSFGPNMSLARELAEKGDTKTVLEYFDLCRVFWKSDRGQLDKWANAIAHGQQPDFGANLNY